MKQLPNFPSWAGIEEASHFPIEEGFFESAKSPDLNEVIEEFVQNLNRETASKF
jgi:hypothetical protein